MASERAIAPRRSRRRPDDDYQRFNPDPSGVADDGGGETVPMLEAAGGGALSLGLDDGRMSRPQKAINIKSSKADAYR